MTTSLELELATLLTLFKTDSSYRPVSTDDWHRIFIFSSFLLEFDLFRGGNQLTDAMFLALLDRADGYVCVWGFSFGFAGR